MGLKVVAGSIRWRIVLVRSVYSILSAQWLLARFRWISQVQQFRWRLKEKYGSKLAIFGPKKDLLMAECKFVATQFTILFFCLALIVSVFWFVPSSVPVTQTHSLLSPQNFLRCQNNKNNYNLVCETLQFLDCICGSTTGGLGLLGLYINEKNVALINQTLESLTEYCQGPCHENQVHKETIPPAALWLYEGTSCLSHHCIFPFRIALPHTSPMELIL